MQHPTGYILEFTALTSKIIRESNAENLYDVIFYYTYIYFFVFK